MKPTQLLQDLCMFWVPVKYTAIRSFGALKLEGYKQWQGRTKGQAYVFLLLVDMANLKPDVLLAERTWRVSNDVLEALPRVNG